MLKYFNKFEWCLILGMIFANLITGGLSNPIGAICSITGVLCVVLVAKGKISNFAFGLVNVVLYIYLAYTWKIYGDVMLNALYYLPIQFIGYFTWKKKMSAETGTVKARKMTKTQFSIMSIGCAASIFLYSQFLIMLGGNTPYLDSTSTVLSIIAQLLMLMMFAEQWLLWIIVNIVSTAMWVVPSLTGDKAAISMVLMWVAYLINSIYGYINWKRMAKIQEDKEEADRMRKSAMAASCPYKIERGDI